MWLLSNSNQASTGGSFWRLRRVLSIDPTTLTGAQLLEIAEAINGTSHYLRRDENGQVISIIIVATGINAAAVDKLMEEAGVFTKDTSGGH
jgi:hypothetical protein